MASKGEGQIMKSIAALVLMILVSGMVGWGLAQTSTSSDLRRAFLDHWKHNLPDESNYFPQMGGANYVMLKRWENYQKSARKCPSIAEVVSVSVGKTVDSSEFVIRMSGPRENGNDNNTCSLWVVGGEVDRTQPVRDMSTY